MTMRIFSILSQLFPPKSLFHVNDVPDLHGKVIIVTGANTGVGKETAKVLLAHNAKVYVACRNREKAEQAIADLKEQTGKVAIWLNLDLSDLKSVKASAEEFLSKERELHILFNNAGVYSPPMDQLTVQGYDLQFGTNVLGHFYFTQLLIPALIAGSKSSQDGKARVVTLSSLGAYGARRLDVELAKDTERRKKTSILQLYAQSKMGNLLFSNELARRYGDEGIISCAAHPGILHSDLYRYTGVVQRFFLGLILYPTAFGALTPLWAGTTAAGLEFNGKFLIPWARSATHLPSAVDDGDAKKLWEWCEEQIAEV